MSNITKTKQEFSNIIINSQQNELDQNTAENNVSQNNFVSENAKLEKEKEKIVHENIKVDSGILPIKKYPFPLNILNSEHVNENLLISNITHSENNLTITQESSTSIHVTTNFLPIGREENTSKSQNMQHEVVNKCEPAVTEALSLPLMHSTNLKDDTNFLFDEYRCVICWDVLLETCMLVCSHMFCSFCISKWVEQKARCPVCRFPIRGILRDRLIDQNIEDAIKVHPDCLQMKSEREKILESRNLERVQNDNEVNDDQEDGYASDEDSFLLTDDFSDRDSTAETSILSSTEIDDSDDTGYESVGNVQMVWMRHNNNVSDLLVICNSTSNPSIVDGHNEIMIENNNPISENVHSSLRSSSAMCSFDTGANIVEEELVDPINSNGSSIVFYQLEEESTSNQSSLASNGQFLRQLSPLFDHYIYEPSDELVKEMDIEVEVNSEGNAAFTAVITSTSTPDSHPPNNLNIIKIREIKSSCDFKDNILDESSSASNSSSSVQVHVNSHADLDSLFNYFDGPSTSSSLKEGFFVDVEIQSESENSNIQDDKSEVSLKTESDDLGTEPRRKILCTDESIHHVLPTNLKSRINHQYRFSKSPQRSSTEIRIPSETKTSGPKNNND